jgi:hypothetical protein
MALLSMQVKYMQTSNWEHFIVPSLERELTLYVSCIGTYLVPILVNSFIILGTRKNCSLCQ